MNGFFGAIALLCALGATRVDAQAGIHDYYSPLVRWRQASGFEVTPIHVGLLPNGSLFFLNNYNFVDHPEVDLTAPGFQPEYMFLMQPTAAFAPLPDSVLIQPLPNPPPFIVQTDDQSRKVTFKSPTCGGHSLTADGNLVIASGADTSVDLNRYAIGDLVGSLTVEGLAESTTYNPFTGAWKNNASMIVPGPQTGEPRRWYATVTRLADSRMLVTGGYEKVYPDMSYNPSVEVFDPVKNAWSVVSDTHETPPGIENPDYTHVFQFPNEYHDPATGAVINTILMLGGSGEPLFLYLNGQSNYWYHTQQFRPGARALASLKRICGNKLVPFFPNHRSSTALLPLRLPEDSWGYSNGSIINVGGEEGPVDNKIDVYDPGAGAWHDSILMNGPRHNPSTVILPDGRILILAGHDDPNHPSDYTGYAEYVDPKSNFALSQGTAYMPEPRGYHTVSVLLPDGRVLIGSGNVNADDAVERSDFRYYYPDYMFKTRPRIEYAPAIIEMGSSFRIDVPPMTKFSEAALVGLGSMTHAFDENQRHVQLRVLDARPTPRMPSQEPTRIRPEQCAENPDLCNDSRMIEAPASKYMAPPGYYMLFILDGNRVPSMGKIVKLE